MSAVLSFRDILSRGMHSPFSYDIEAGMSVAILTTCDDESSELSRFVTGISRPEQGAVLICGKDPASLSTDERVSLRQRIGIVPFGGGMVSNLKLWENITLPLLYHRGSVSSGDEKAALGWLKRFGYTGRVMSLPAHLSPHERRIGAWVRMLLGTPEIVMYVNCFDEMPPAERQKFLDAAREFHAAADGRITIFLTSVPNLADWFATDAVVKTSSIHTP